MKWIDSEDEPEVYEAHNSFKEDEEFKEIAEDFMRDDEVEVNEDWKESFNNGIMSQIKEKGKLTCGVSNCVAFTADLCRTCSACKNKKRCRLRKCLNYKKILDARSKAVKKCKKCHRGFSTHSSLVRHYSKSNCGTIARKWGNLPHKCLICEDGTLYENHESFIKHTISTHGGKIWYKVRCPMVQCQAFIKPNKRPWTKPEQPEMIPSAASLGSKCLCR
ncbi:MAG: hypothetical protein GY760_24875 [Deltaproteobacteria bacterium]|nr:hypothetical protein [Deltaproteobacteria bacterium]